ncbi:MAG: hypothetical protein EA425_15250 [Puniceicoccaceae bacterium]|nr:MAG: hypothetical protein EA425_15250 [Puniceicoccaceae bacterium]
MFRLIEEPIDAAALREAMRRPEAGALVVFEGWVRNHHGGRPVTRLEYEAFAEMAVREGEALVEAVERDFPGVAVTCVHRCGDLVPGEVAVWVGAASAHRDDAFRAGRLVIEEVKRRLPIWKKEHHPGEAPVWVNCSEENTPVRRAADYCERQASLPEVGAAGQARLAGANVLIVGLGGLGCPAALYLAGAGVGRLALLDGSRVEYSNLHRQVLFEAGDVGGEKAVRAALALRARNPHITVEPMAADLGPGNVRPLITGRSVVLDCTDNFATRLLLHDACSEAGVPLVQAAVHRWEGVLQVFQPGGGGCLYCTGLAGSPAELEGAGNCAGAPVFGPAVGVLGLLQASEAVKCILERPATERAAAATLLLDLLATSITRIARPRRSDCPYCAAPARPKTARETEPEATLWRSRQELAEAGAHRVLILATRAEREQFGWHRDGRDCFDPTEVGSIRRAVAASPLPVVLACPHGIRSAALARALRADGEPRVYALQGGLADGPLVSPVEP